MSLSMYQSSIPVFIRLFDALTAILDKAAAHAAAKKFDTSVYLTMRLAPDMLTFAHQIRIASDNAKGCAARLAGVEPPKFADEEKTLDELKERLAKTSAYLKTLKPEQFNGSETRAITLEMRSGTLHFNGLDYLLNFGLPNVYFHVTTAYNLLRHAGVDIGKKDFLGKIQG